MRDSNAVVVMLGVLAATFFFLFWIKKALAAKAAADTEKALAQAAQLGIQTELVDREVPFYGGGNKFQKLVPDKVMRFSINRPGSGDWTFLMRPPAGEELFGENYTYASASGPPSTRLRQILQAAVERLEVDGGFLELEAKGGTISVYCDTDHVGWFSENAFEWLPQLSRL
jgi:hypothetical protein